MLTLTGAFGPQVAGEGSVPFVHCKAYVAIPKQPSTTEAAQLPLPAMFGGMKSVVSTVVDGIVRVA